MPFADAATLELKVTKENAHSKAITSVAFNPVDGKTIISGSNDKSIKVWGTRLALSTAATYAPADHPSCFGQTHRPSLNSSRKTLDPGC